MIGKILCWLGVHKFNKEEWHENYGWGEKYLGEWNVCNRCGNIIYKKHNG